MNNMTYPQPGDGPGAHGPMPPGPELVPDPGAYCGSVDPDEPDDCEPESPSWDGHSLLVASAAGVAVWSAVMLVAAWLCLASDHWALACVVIVVVYPIAVAAVIAAWATLANGRTLALVQRSSGIAAGQSDAAVTAARATDDKASDLADAIVEIAEELHSNSLLTAKLTAEVKKLKRPVPRKGSK